MLHCGAHQTDLNTVFAAPLPEGTETHTPVAHKFVIDTVMNLLSDYGFSVNEQAHALSHEGMRYFGLLNVGNNKDDFSQVVGIRNSNDKKFPVGMTMGSRVFVCDNLAFSGEVSLKRKHTSKIFQDITQRMVDTMAKLKGFFTNQENRFESYKQMTLSDAKASELILRASKHGALPKSKILDVYDEYMNPSHSEFEDRNVWSLYNAFTEIHKQRPSVVELPKKTMRMTTLFDQIVDFKSDFLEMEESPEALEMEVLTA